MDKQILPDINNAEYTIIVEGNTIVDGKKMKKIVWKYNDGHAHS